MATWSATTLRVVNVGHVYVFRLGACPFWGRLGQTPSKLYCKQFAFA
jgi:hypothetical protein